MELRVGTAPQHTPQILGVQRSPKLAGDVSSQVPRVSRVPIGLGLGVLGVACAPRAARAPRSRGSATQCRYSAETTRVIGDWADGSIEAGEVELVVSELAGGIVQYRSVHAKGSSRYGDD